MSSFKPLTGDTLLATLVDQCECGIVLLDTYERVRVWNDWLVRHSGVDADVARGRQLVHLFPSLDGSRLVKAVEQAFDGKAALLSPRVNRTPLPLYQRGPGRALDREMHQLVIVRPLNGPDGERYCLIHVTDVSASVERESALREQAVRLEALMRDLRDSEQRVKHMAQHDTLTGLPNRALFLDRLEMTTAHAERNGTRFGLMFIDLDHFKQINDSLGHHVGDELLKRAAERIQHSIRAADTAARLGGDEFAVIQSDLDREDGTAILADKLLTELSRPYRIDGHTFSVTASIGVSVFPNDDSDPTELLKNADMAMYHAKRDQRNNFQRYDPGMEQAELERVRLERELRAALADGQFILHYQPQIGARDGELVGVEALVRWAHPEYGLVMPGSFIPAAEQSGLIVELGHWVLRESCRQRRQWEEQRYPDFKVMVNLSVAQFHDPDLVAFVERVLAETQLRPELLEIEITESVLMDDVQAAAGILRALRALGITLALDDFGTGYSSLQYLQGFAVDKIKIDRSFVHELDCGGDGTIVRAVVGLGHNIGHEVIAEGVESEAQLEKLRAWGCDTVQGFLFSPAVPSDELEAFMLARIPGEVA